MERGRRGEKGNKGKRVDSPGQLCPSQTFACAQVTRRLRNATYNLKPCGYPPA